MIASSASTPAPLPDPVPCAVPASARSYRAIVRTSAVIGGSSALNVAIGIVRTKALAMLLGPAGYGLMGAYSLVVDLARTLSQMGLGASGVRRIAAAVGTGDRARIALTVAVLRRTSLACGLIGALALAAFARPVAVMTFGDDAHAGGVALLGAAVFLSVVAGGQSALLQGMRRVGDLARLTVVGGIASTVVGVPLVWFYGEDGVAPTLVAIAAAISFASWRYARRVRVDEVGAPSDFDAAVEPHAWPSVQVPAAGAAQLWREAGSLLRLGLVFMATGLVSMGAAYAVRILVLHHDGLAGAGIYQAAWTIGGVYIGFVLQSLGTDFYPRLVVAMREPEAGHRLVDEQTRIGLLIALPGVLATITLAPLALHLLYSPAFAAAASTLRWICLGMALRVLTWPIGFIVIALDRQRLFVAIEIAWAAANVGLAAWCVPRWGVDGAGIAFLGAYVVHAAILVPVVRATTGFRFSAANRRLMATGAAAVVVVFVAFRLLPFAAATALGLAATAIAALGSARAIVTLVAPSRLPRALAWLNRHGGRA
jgi:PST family polysaccharide transporter